MLRIARKVIIVLAVSVVILLSACQQQDKMQGNDTNQVITEAGKDNNKTESADRTADKTAEKASDKLVEKTTEAATEHKHTYQEMKVAGNCVTYPKTIYTCSICGDTYEEVNEGEGYGEHQYTENRVHATCTEPAKMIYVCSICGNSYSNDDEDEPALGHNYTSQSVVVAATNNSPGIKRFACDRCGEYNDADYALPQSVNTYSGTKVVYGYWDTACEKEIMNILNSYREANGLKSFKTYASLNQTAHIRAMEIAFSYRHNHSRPDNNSWRTAYSSSLTACGENIASGQEDAQAVMDAWEHSSSHNENMLNDMFDSVGIGVFVRVDCEESGEVTEPDPDGLSYHTRYYVQSFSD